MKGEAADDGPGMSYAEAVKTMGIEDRPEVAEVMRKAKRKPPV